MRTLSHDTLKGSWATLLLTTDNDGRVDYSRLSDEIDVLIASRPDGIYSNGTACEFYSQDIEEYLKINELLAIKCNSANIPFQIGASHPCAQESLLRLKLSIPLNPSAVQIILPDWFPVDDRAAVSFLEVMAGNAMNVPLVLYNPPHAKRVLLPEEWQMLKKEVPALIGVKVFDNNRSEEWYARMRQYSAGISVFVPGHHLATGILNGAAGSYSNMACLNPFAAKKWYDTMRTDIATALELEERINRFMSDYIDPLIVSMHYPNHAIDRFMALVGGWADVGSRMRWPYSSVPESYIPKVRKQVYNLIPEFFYL